MFSGFAIKRTDQGGGYVAPAGNQNAYTHKLENARQYPTAEAAERDRCPENEIIIRVGY